MILENISGIGLQMSVAMSFLNDLKEDLRNIESKIDDIKKNVTELSINLQYLRGKNVF